jgi:mRNA interferase RelE/StbE
MFNIEYSNQPKRFLKSCDKHIALRIIERIEKLKENSVPQDAKFISRDNGDMIFRYRIGDYRTLYKIKHSEKVILIAKLDKRSKVYD